MFRIIVGIKGQCSMHHQLLEVTITPIGDQERLSADVKYHKRYSPHKLLG